MRKFYPVIIIVILLSNTSCENKRSLNQDSFTDSNYSKSVNNEYLDKYSGGYTVELENISSNDAFEVYILKNNGEAKWMYIKNDGNGNADIESEKSGNWTASEINISITCEGNSGPITEDFKLKDGRFYDTLTGERYLKPKE